ncbi:DUF3140 domain-containing protein [Micromonospora sp. BL1]|uniref:DUF3140 domain-containing protein n=3 Tax=Micromonospora TaxID=1873 RepID=A0ABQ6U806_9ACTN|nr:MULTISPECIES: DUF3140 domain-containing protein [Micromonospora]ADL47891.1 Protein of unknown function DUF3140 [Micromonospora aurantiaca ATCC 27029]AYF26406.1 DUF3140 domain-containing protein [Micromonospora tulbaghiae]OHX06647.1 DNA-binding protein [Micromonospora sp. WMMB235]RLQ11402.1 DUF3140 domain-containing protein [Micromonospora sp. BL1]KAB1101772.1 DUF3140 domain-containing protein [Micromonospora aurantiaca]
MSRAEDPQQTYREFTDAVNMKPGELSRWLESEESKHVGWHKKGTQGGESVGHDSGRRIVDLLRRKRADLTAADYKHMRKVIGYVHRHLAQRPAGDVRDTRWRWSLMNWGHDPLKG